MGDPEAIGRFFRNAWVTGVQKYYPGTPKPGYIVPWEEMDQWEKDSAIATYEQVKAFLLAGIYQGQFVTHLTKEQGGRLVCIFWTAQMYLHFGNTKPSYTNPWEKLPEWQQHVDADIFEIIQAKVLQDMGNNEVRE
jgi:hypothetical protein